MEKIKITELKPHELNSKIYNDTYDENLFNSIKEKGILNPLLITKDNRIISGHRRFESAKKLGLEELSVFVSDLTDDLDIREAVIVSNEQRIKTNEQKLREYKEIKEIEKERAKQRQGTRTDIQEKIPGSENGQARDLAAAKISMSGKTAEKGAKVVDAIDKCIENNQEDRAKELRNALNNKNNISRACKIAEDNGLIDDKIPPDIDGDIQPKPTFNKLSGKTGFSIFTWNPLTGCNTGCEYCYARDIAYRFKDLFPKGFELDFKPERLDAPKNTKLPKEAEKDIRYKSVFVCTMSDLFGDGVKQEWIDAVFNIVRNTPQWNFLFLTKFPERMVDIEFPENSWAGATIDKKFRIERTEKAFQRIKAKVKFLYFEPLLEDITEGMTKDLTSFLSMFDWIVIGSRSKTKDLPAFQPKWEWVENLLIQTRKAGCLVYFKPNLEVRPQEYPKYSDSFDKRLSNLEERLHSESFQDLMEKWNHINSNHNGKKEYINNFQLDQLLKEMEDGLNGNADKKDDKPTNDTITLTGPDGIKYTVEMGKQPGCIGQFNKDYKPCKENCEVNVTCIKIKSSIPSVKEI